MSMTFLEGQYVVIPPGHASSMYDYGQNSFGYSIGNSQHHWHSCRDKVQGVHSAVLSNGFIFTHKAGKGQDIAAFLHKIESTLELPDKTIFRETDLPKALWMKLAPFWLTSFMQRSFLTMALRCGAYYNSATDNFNEALCSINYAHDTQPAIRRFLGGFTHYVGAVTTDMSEGWHTVFLGRDKQFANQFLKAGEELVRKRAFLGYLNRIVKGEPGDADTDWRNATFWLAKE